MSFPPFSRCGPEEADKDVLSRHCRFLRSILEVMLHSHVTSVDSQNFTIGKRILLSKLANGDF